MKINKCLALVACLFFVGCDYIYEKAEVTKVRMVDKYDFIMFTKTPNSEVVIRRFTYYPSYTNIHIYADVKDGEPMWYEGNMAVGMDSWQWLNVHIKPDYDIKLQLEKKDE